jgi:hypothetical protein
MSEEFNFATQVLGALAKMAKPRRRKEVFLSDALHAAGLPLDPERVEAALLLLRHQGCIDKPVPLANGDLLLRVTGRTLQPPESLQP